MADLPPPSSPSRSSVGNPNHDRECPEETQGCSDDTQGLTSWRRLFRVWGRIQHVYDSTTEAQVDEWLEWLRQTNRQLPVIVQIVSNWGAAAFVFLYYSWAYYRACRASATEKKRERLPLMTEASAGSNEDVGGGDALLRETHRKLRELLSQQGLLSSSGPSSPHRFLPPSSLCWTPDRRHEGDSDRDPQRRWVVNEEEWIQEIRQNSSLRRLVSRFMQHEGGSRRLDATLFDALDGIYERLIPLPPAAPQQGQEKNTKRIRNRDNNDDDTYLHEVSAIVPCHDSEPIELVRRTIQSLLRHCRHPDRVQLVLVHAVDDPPPVRSADDSPTQKVPRLDLKALLGEVRENQLDRTSRWWGDAKCVTYRGGGGRGPTLNLGAVCSQGQILVFVHSDCQLPRHWDTKVSSRILRDPSVSATSFLLGVDCSGTSWIKSLLFGSTEAEADIAYQYPWGILAVQIMVNLRTYFFRMPYGDQGIAIRSRYFAYIGGFPNQPIMEDFDFMSYLRRRSKHLENRERYSLIGSICWSSPRRWQRVGVLYVTIGNAILVHRYTRKHDRWSPQRVFDYYYNKRPSNKQPHNLSAKGNDDQVSNNTSTGNNDKLD